MAATNGVTQRNDQRINREIRVGPATGLAGQPCQQRYLSGSADLQPPDKVQMRECPDAARHRGNAPLAIAGTRDDCYTSSQMIMVRS